MAVSGAQEFWVAGARAYIMPDPAAGTTTDEYLLDMGVVTAVEPTIETTEATLYDSDGGRRTKADVVEVGRDEMYNLTLANFNPDNLNILYGGNGITNFSQTTASVTDVTHRAHPGRLMKIKDANGAWVYGLSAIDAISDSGGSPDFTAGTDYEVVDLERGIVRIIAGGAISAEQDVLVDYTGKALTGNRLILPQTGKGTVYAKVALFLGRCDNAQQHVREMRCAINTESISVPTEEHATWVAKFDVIEDFTNVSQPFGRMLHFVGDVPSLS